MKKALPVLLLLFSVNLYAQKSNSLLQIISNNSMLNRSQEFRELQYDIGDRMDKQGLGLNADSIVQKIIDKLKSAIDSIDITITKESLIIAWKKNNDLMVFTNGFMLSQFKGHSLRFIINQIQLYLENNIQKFLEEGIPVIKSQPQPVKNLAYLTIMLALYKDSYSHQELKKMGNSYSALLSRFIVESTVCNSVLNYLVENQKWNLDDNIPDIETKLNEVVAVINKAFKESETQLKELFKKNLESAEYNLKKTLNEVSTWLANANVGVAVSEGEGNLGGGLHVLFKAADFFQLGAFYSGQINTVTQTDTSQNKTSNATPLNFFGLQLRWAINNLELDAITSFIEGPVQQRDKSYELGLGVSFCISDRLIIGGAYFFSKNARDNSSDPNIHTAGISFKSTDPNTPTLILGFIIPDHGNLQPMFQLSYPIQILKVN